LAARRDKNKFIWGEIFNAAGFTNQNKNLPISP